MARHKYDIGSKWLLQYEGKGALLIGGMENVRRCEPMPGEVVQNRRLPDGMLRVFIGTRPKPSHALVEIATYPERRALTQAIDDLTLAYSALGHLPELLMLVLRPKGKFRIEGRHSILSEHGLSRLEMHWRVVELWTLPAEKFLAEGDVGVVPWIPLMRMEHSLEVVLEQCAKRIEREAPEEHRGDLLAISEVMIGLRFPGSELLKLFAGAQVMVESPVVQRWKAESLHEAILAILKDRFGGTPRDVTKPLRAVLNEKKLIQLSRIAASCTDLDAFRGALSS